MIELVPKVRTLTRGLVRFRLLFPPLPLPSSPRSFFPFLCHMAVSFCTFISGSFCACPAKLGISHFPKGILSFWYKMVLKAHNPKAICPCSDWTVDIYSRQSQEICNFLKRKISNGFFPWYFSLSLFNERCNIYFRSYFFFLVFFFLFATTQAVCGNSWARDWTYAAQQQPEPQKWERTKPSENSLPDISDSKLFKGFI